jgi:hypothetical protein
LCISESYLFIVVGTVRLFVRVFCDVCECFVFSFAPHVAETGINQMSYDQLDGREHLFQPVVFVFTVTFCHLCNQVAFRWHQKNVPEWIEIASV